MFRKVAYFTLFSLQFTSFSVAEIDPRCSALGTNLPAVDQLTDSKLFFLTVDGWQEVSESSSKAAWFSQSVMHITSKGKEFLRFIYVPKPDNSLDPQFLAIKTAVKNPEVNDFVVLRKHHRIISGGVFFGSYQDYHKNLRGGYSVLRNYHFWDRNVRSDEPTSTRSAFAFQNEKESSSRRLLSIRYETSRERVTCVPFRLGTNLSESILADDGESEVSLHIPFRVEITEARTADGNSGRTFTLLGETVR